VTTVRDASQASPQHTAGPRCHCGTPIAHTPGKRPRVYCSEACRSAARRAIQRGESLPPATGEAGRTATKNGRRLGTSVETATPAGQSVAAATGNGGRDDRYDRRDRHQAVSLGTTFRGCGRKLIAGGATVQAGAAGASFAGVATCGMVHMCTWCGARILGARADYAQQAAEAWIANGGGVVMTAHTLRHYRRMSFGTLRKRERGGLVAVVHDGWSGAYGHRSGKMWQQAKRTHGIVGVLRSFEDTWGEDTGFHLHFHAMWFTERPLTPAEVDALADVLSARWSRAVVAAGGYRPSDSCDKPGCPCKGRGHGVRVDHVDTTEAGAVGRYLFKDGDKARTEPLDGIGAEIAFGTEKEGRRGGRLGPFQLGDLAATGEAAAVEAWQEREYGVFGVRKMYLSNGMKARLAELGIVDDRTDQEIAADEGQEQREPIAVIPRDTWYQHVVPVRGRRLELLKAAEVGGVPAVRALVESWGLVWGRDVLPAPTPE
jgi:hypothetical protein